MTKRRIHLVYLSSLFLLASAIVVFEGARRTTAGARVEKMEPGHTWPSPTTRLRLATFNIASGMNPGGVVRTVSQAKANVVALQEVGCSLFNNEAITIGGATVMDSAWAPSERRWWLNHFGNGFLANVPVVERTVLVSPLPQTQERGHRNVTIARVRFGDAVVTVLGTHVDRQVDQAAQLAFLAELFMSVPEPAVMMGDFNVTVAHPAIVELLARNGVSYVGDSDPRRIELIFARGLRGEGAGIVELHASDHPLVWADVELLPRPATRPAVP